MTNWPERILWCWRCFRFTVHTGRDLVLKVRAVDSVATGQIGVTLIICRRCFNRKRVVTELDHLETAARQEED
jgi:hypothetical protein